MTSAAPALALAPAPTASTDSGVDPYIQIMRSGVVLFVSMMAVLVALAFVGPTP